MTQKQNPLLQVKGLKTCFQTRHGLVRAVDGVDLEVHKGECLGIVGESGSGKSVTFMSVMGLVKKPGWIEDGEVIFEGKNLLGLSAKEYRKMRGKDFAMTMQDALTALNPAYTVGNQIIEVLLAHNETLVGSKRQKKVEARKKALEIMSLLGIPSPEKRLDEYPHQFSGGMRQRIMIAIALACHPKLLIADEPTTALDVTIQAQVLDLIADIRKQLEMSVVLITHDLGVVAEHCDRVAVMYAGQVIETGKTEDVIENPQHPYTQGLLRSIPKLSQPDKEIEPIEGQVPDLINFPPQCRFYERCEHAHDACLHDIAMVPLGGGREIRCVLKGGKSE